MVQPQPLLCHPLLIKEVLILAIWPTKCKGVTDAKLYPQITQEIINEYAPYFAERKVIVIGDFNCYINQPDKSNHYGDMLQIHETLETLGLYSAYHQTTGEALGKESAATYYHLFKPNMPFFIDYTQLIYFQDRSAIISAAPSSS